jgi:hypothetical protein
VNATLTPKRKGASSVAHCTMAERRTQVSVWSTSRTNHRPKFGSLRNAQIDACEGRRRSSPQEPLSALRRLIAGDVASILPHLLP